MSSTAIIVLGTVAVLGWALMRSAERDSWQEFIGGALLGGAFCATVLTALMSA